MAVTLPWSCTFDCDDWLQYNDPLDCCGLNPGGSWTCGWTYGATIYEQITSAANYPGGAGGKGQRHWLGPGENECSGGTYLYFATSQYDVYFRWYMRYQSGFQGGGGGTGNKVLYWFSNSVVGVLVMRWDSVNMSWEGFFPYVYSTGGGWLDLFPSGISDGTWHYFEMRTKIETQTSPANGIWQLWVDGVQKANITNINYGLLGSGWEHVLIGSNVKGVLNSVCMAVDYDDIAIATTGPIGPLDQSVIVKVINDEIGIQEGRIRMSKSIKRINEAMAISEGIIKTPQPFSSYTEQTKKVWS